MRPVRFVTTQNSKERPEVVWHYTSVDSLVGIVQGREVWASARSSMNDRSEMTYDKLLLKAVVGRLDEEGWLRDGVARPPDAETRAFLDEVLAIADKGAPGLGVVAVSASTERDKLSQWVHYAGAGGVSIGFDANAVMVPLDHFSKDQGPGWPTQGFGWMRLEYQREQQESAVRDALEVVLRAASDEGAGSRSARIEVQGWSLLTSLQHMKHPAYAEESEIRHFPPSFGGERMRFRTRGFDVVAYAPLISQQSRGPDLSERAPLAIREVVCGPALPARSLYNIRALLNANELESVPVTHSMIPYVPTGVGG